MRAKKQSSARLKEFRNAKLRRRYHVGERFEAGIALTGTEIKSIRAGRAQIGDAFAKIEDGKVRLYHAHIAPYEFGSRNNHEPYRPRDLLLHKREIRKIESQIKSGGRLLIPTRMYFKKALIKVELAVCESKKLHDRREDLKKRVALREAERSIRTRDR